MNLLEPVYYFVYLKSTDQLMVCGIGQGQFRHPWIGPGPLNVAYDTKLILDDQGGSILKPIQNPSIKPASVTGQVHF